jgi:hypothetical protein
VLPTLYMMASASKQALATDSLCLKMLIFYQTIALGFFEGFFTP